VDARPVEAHSVASRIRAGMVWINSYKRINPGRRSAGRPVWLWPRDGFEAMREYTEPKSVWVNVDAAIPPFYPRPKRRLTWRSPSR